MKNLIVELAKKLIPGFIFSLFLILISLFLIPGLNEFIFKPEENAMLFFDKPQNSFSGPGKVIDEENEVKFSENFTNKLCQPLKLDTLKAMWWNRNIGGWQVDSKLLEEVIIKQNEKESLKDPIEEVWFRLGEREDTITKKKSMTILIFGVDKVDLGKGKFKYSIRTKNNEATRNILNSEYFKVANDNYVIEYVQPCKPPCK
ncbi:hypothetical protein [Lacihabitans sp. CS3-21]|uniref:hypothetical protein n=1 Tax=Lacihabitans sp. CS3-21 TaxID=2487332 RepID=UPI0020CF233D|nr:hypothetical protein [Lacihabitans sp. CS3-21]